MTDSSPVSNTPPPPYVEPRDHALALLTLGELRTLESRASASLPANTLMGRAVAAAAQFVIDQNRHMPHLASLPVWIVAGPGNNGGDALVMAARLRQAGIDVEVCMPVEVKPDDARWALAEARQAGVKITTEAPPSFDNLGCLVDGMFGIGLGRPDR